ncbi:MAG: TerB family tellurite resistance protein [Pseudomonadales bacterium]|nr:TerB family tellurite resistance protein [Pseudomonadales bacterium]
MISTFKKFLENTLTGKTENNALSIEKQLQVATAALFVEMTLADTEVLPEEKASVETSLTEAFNLTASELSEIMALAKEKSDAATCLHEFTIIINKNYSPDQKIEVIKLLWRIAYADGQLDKYEELMIRKVSDLISVSHSKMIMAKHCERPTP